jgi:hypothetical protein
VARFKERLFLSRLTDQSRWLVAAYGLAALGALCVGILQFRHGIVHLLDTVTYWSGTEATTNGHPFTTNLAPSFSNFSAIEFLERSGRLPFVDFPVGYPLVAGTIGIVIGSHHAMELLCVIALIGVAIAFIAGAHRSKDSKIASIVLGATGILITISPAMRLVTQGALSEPLFCAVALWLVIALAKFRSNGKWTPVVALSIAAGLLRFIGAPLAILAGWERYQKTGRKLSSLIWTIAMMAPAALNILLASAAGGGHNAGWRGLGRIDIEVFVRSIGGWFDAKQGDLRRTYFTSEGPSWWSWLVAITWLAIIILALYSIVRRRHFLTATAELALGAAAIISAGLVAGMMGFDALVIADNRLMLPTGILTLAAVVWSAHDFVNKQKGARLPQSIASASVALILFALFAVRPWNITESFSDSSELKPYSIAALQSGAKIIITNDADAVHWDTGLPAAYAPLPVKALTGESQDVTALYEALPCALLQHDGAVVLSDAMTFSGADIGLLAQQVDSGRLTLEEFDGASVYFATATACN